MRGWNWHQEPLKPYYDDVKLPMYAVSSKYCPTGRDIYLRQVEGVKARPNFKMALGKLIHGVVSDSLLSFMEQRYLMFDEWWQRVRWEEIPAQPESLRKQAEVVWDYVVKLCEAKCAELMASQPYASRRDIIASAVPFLIEHKISGNLLGLSGLLSLDCYDYLRCIMFELKVEDKKRDWHKLMPTGYALVFESVHEVPVDIGCIVYVNFIGDKLTVKKDMFFISDELRRWWIEERDEKLEIVAEGKDPGLPPDSSECSPDCMYYGVCYG